MRLEDFSETGHQGMPPKDLIDAQVKRICDEMFLPSKRTPADLLEFLVEMELVRQRYEEPFTEEKPRPSSKEIGDEFYAWRRERFGDPIPSSSDTAIRKVVEDLCEGLNNFYGLEPNPEVKGPVFIQIQTGRGNAYRPEVKWTPNPSTKSSASMLSSTSDEERSSTGLIPIDSNDRQYRGKMSIEMFLGTFHYYHMSIRNGETFWAYTVLTFRQSQFGRLVASATNFADSRKSTPNHRDIYEASIMGSHLLVLTQREGRPNYVSIDVFPNADGRQWPLYGATIHTTWDDEVVKSASILNEHPLSFATDAKDGQPVEDHIGAQLSDGWKRFSDIDDLPYAW